MKYKGLKKILLVAIMLCAVLCLKSNVSAEEKNNSLKIKVVSDGKEYCYDDYNSYYNLSELDTVSYDSDNCILTLNNFIGESISISAERDYSPKKLTIKVVGENHIKRSLKEDYASSALLAIWGESTYKRLNVKFTGSGTLDFDSQNQTSRVLLAYTCNVTIDGPNLNFKNCNSGIAKYLGVGVHYGVYPVEAGEFIVKSGNINMDIWPVVYKKYSEDHFSYGYAIRTIYKVDIAGGKLNVSYKFPRDEYNGESISYEDAVVLGCWYEEPKTTNINLSEDEEIKGKTKLKHEHKISVKCVKTSNDDEGVLCDDVNLVPGITWDESTKTLTLDGYDDGQIYIKSEKYRENIKVVIKNKNNVKHEYHPESDDIYIHGFDTENVDLEFVGDGTIDIDDSLWMKSEQMTLAGRDGYEPRGLVINGPHIEANNICEVENFTMKSGKVVVCARNQCGIKVIDNISISGGTLIGYLQDNTAMGQGKDKFIVVGRGCTGTVENCVIICTGYVEHLKENDLAIGTYTSDGYCKPANVTINNVLTYYVYKLLNVPTINIDRFKASIPEKEYVYTGKEIRPTVKVGGLIEGEDYTVTYTNNKMIGKANIIVSGVGLYKGNIKITFDIVKKKTGSGKGKSTDKSDAIKYKKLLYRVVSEAKSNSKYGKVELVGSVNNKCKKITIPKVVKINNKKYRVVSIAKKAFADCKKLKKVIIKSTSIKKIGKKAFAGKKKITIKVPKKKKKAYKKLLKKAKIKCKVL